LHENDGKLLEATRRLLDLQTEKKDYDKTMNESIKIVKAEIAELAKDPAF
jgi:hypothetical protein